MKPPFNLLVIGDSILWGVGLHNDLKIHNEVSKYISRDLDRDINLLHFAGTGATLRGNCDDAADVPLLSSGRITTLASGQELVGLTPGVKCQIEIAKLASLPNFNDEDDPEKSTAEKIDLVMVDGGINDIGISALTLPFPFIDGGLVDDEEYSERVDEICNQAMGDVLLELGNTFVNAKFVVTGYFPVFSEESRGSVDQIILICCAMALITLPLLPVFTVALLFGAEIGVAALLDHLKKRSDLWKKKSDEAYQAAVDRANETFPGRFAFASPNFASDECALAPQSKFFGMDIKMEKLDPDDPFAVVQPVDDIAAERLALCEEEGLEGESFTISRLASLGHPTPWCAVIYATEILLQLRKLHVLPVLLGNRHSRELHSLNMEKKRCQIWHMISERKIIFNDSREARREGYDNCAWCLGNSQR